MLFFAWVVSGCEVDPPLAAAGDIYVLEIPEGFPEPVIPADNPLTQAKVDLGRMLFYDPILSLDTTVSCASCHIQEKAFSDIAALSEGIEGRLGFRNAPGLFNLAWHDKMNKDGGTPNLELQLLVPIQDENEMGLNLALAAQRLQEHPTYPAYFREAFGTEPTTFGLTRALSSFERTLISADSPWDRFYYHGEEDALSAAAKRGWSIFQSDSTHCSTCHAGFNFTTFDFENNGLYAHYADSGRARVTLRPEDAGLMKVASLRNIELTWPYMHDGSLRTLEEVVDHYASGGAGHRNQSPLIQGFSLTTDQKSDLIAFLKSLTDESFLQNPEYSAPFLP